MVEVPDSDQMDDLTFLKHLDKRHPETGTERALHKSKHIQSAWVGAYRAFHERQHRNEPELYDHEHVWDDDDD